MKTSSLSEKRSEQRSERADAKRWVALVLVSMALFMDALDVSIVNTALPNIQHDLQLTTTDLQWVQGIYVLTYAGLLLLGGRAADLLGRRRIFLIGATLFGLSSLICGLAASGWMLILARGIQGIGAALTVPSAVSIITTTFPEGPERNRALGIFTATAASGFSFGLVFGGILTGLINWHWVFFVNVPFVLLILSLARMVIPEDQRVAGSRSYDIAGAVTVTAGLLLLVYTITQASESGATPLKTAGLFALTLLILACFIAIEGRARAPLIPLRIFRSSTTCAANLASLTLLGTFFGFLFITTLYLQDVLHYSPVLASLALLPGSISSALVSQFIAPWLVNRLGMKLTSGLGLLCQAGGMVLFTRIGLYNDYVGVILPSTLIVMGLGMGIGYPALAIAAVSGIADTEQGLAAGLQSTSLQAGGGLWLSITAAAVTTSTASLLHAPTAIPPVLAQLNGFHVGLFVVAAGAAAGALIALAGIRQQAKTPSDASNEP